MDDEGHFLAPADEVFFELFVVRVEGVVLREILDALARRQELVVGFISWMRRGVWVR